MVGRGGFAVQVGLGQLLPGGDREPVTPPRSGGAALPGGDDPRRNAGDSFVIGVATIGLFTLRAIDGREQEALAGYREAIELFARTGYWTHQWITLRNLGILLRRLGDVETAEVIEAAADLAPDAPATPATSRQLAMLTTDRSPDSVVRPHAGVPGRAEILDLARRAIERQLNRS